MRNREQRKAELMKQLEEAIERVLDWQEEHETFTLTELEEFVLGVRREMGEEVAELLIGGLKSKVVIEGLHCEHCGSKLVYKGLETKQTETRMGGIELERGRYWCPTCKQGIFPPG